MTSVPISQASIPTLRSAARRALFVALGVVFPMHSAFACIREEGSFAPPIFVIVYGIIMLAVAVLTLVVWAIKRIFFGHSDLFLVFLVAASLLALVLGVLGTFVVPMFEPIYANFGADIPLPTKTLFSARHLLWLPAIVVLALWHTTKNRTNKTRETRYFAIALFVEANLLALVWAALYTGIFKLGSVCG